MVGTGGLSSSETPHAPFPEVHPRAQLAGLRRDIGVSKVFERATQAADLPCDIGHVG